MMFGCWRNGNYVLIPFNMIHTPDIFSAAKWNFSIDYHYSCYSTITDQALKLLIITVKLKNCEKQIEGSRFKFPSLRPYLSHIFKLLDVTIFIRIWKEELKSCTTLIKVFFMLSSCDNAMLVQCVIWFFSTSKAHYKANSGMVLDRWPSPSLFSRNHLWQKGVCVLFQNRKAFLLCSATSGHMVGSAQFIAALRRSSSPASSKVPTALQSKASPLLVCTVSPYSESSPMSSFTLPQMGHFPKYVFLIYHPSNNKHSAKWSTELLNC